MNGLRSSVAGQCFAFGVAYRAAPACLRTPTPSHNRVTMFAWLWGADHSWAAEFLHTRHDLGRAESVLQAAACISRLREIQREFEAAAAAVAQVVVRELYLQPELHSVPKSQGSVLPAHVIGGIVVLVANDSLACMGGDEAAAKFEVRLPCSAWRKYGAAWMCCSGVVLCSTGG